MSSDGRVNNCTGEQKLPASDAKPVFTVPPSPSRGNKNKASFFAKPFPPTPLPTIAEPEEGAVEGQHSLRSSFTSGTAQQSTCAHMHQRQGEPSSQRIETESRQQAAPSLASRLALKKSRVAALSVEEENSICIGEPSDTSDSSHSTAGEHGTDVTMSHSPYDHHLGHTHLRVLPPSPMRQLSSHFTAKSLQLPPLVYPDNHAPIVMHTQESSPPAPGPAPAHAPSARHPVAPSSGSDGPSHRIHSPVAAVSCSRDGSLVECELRVAHHCEQGVRGSMEDEVIIEQNIDINGSSSPLRGPLSFYAVCDGHGGKNAAIFTRDNLGRVLMDDVKAGKDITESLTAAFIKVDKDFIASGKDPSGTTAATLLLDQSTGNVWVANVGDSRVVLSRAGEALPLSRDHRCDRQDEVERIRKAGGFVIQSRVMGELAVTRSIGDADFKDDELNLVIAEPEIEHNRLQDDDEFVLIACDGLFDVMTNEAAIAYVRQHLRKHNDPERAARDLVHHAIHELNTRDNVSVVLICLKDDYSGVTPS